MKTYEPSKEILEKYADVLVNFALGGGTGIKKGDVVSVEGGEASRPLYIILCKAVWKAGGHVIQDYSLDTYSNDDNLSRFFFENANDEQINFFQKEYLRGFVNQIDHRVIILADTNLQALNGVDPSKIMRRSEANKLVHEWLDKKENSGKYTWTIGMYGTEAMAKEAGLSMEEYWQEIIKACYLDFDDPIAKWKEVYAQINEYVDKLNQMPIEWVKITGEDMDLTLKIGDDRKWQGGSGRNVPSFEIFTSPDWRGAEGWARFNQPLYRYGNLVEGIELKFFDGKVVKSSATKNEKVLKEMIATKNADKIGEFSLTDSRFSRITKFMAETLYDENIGGQFGNTHIALGASYHDCFNGDQSKPNKAEWARRGFNDSSVHTDIVSTSNRTVTAILSDNSEVVIYKNGKFTL